MNDCVTLSEAARFFGISVNKEGEGMTDRWNGFIVTLDRNLREDDAQPIMEAIQMLKGVQHVEPSVASPISTDVMEMQVRAKLALEMGNLARDVLRGNDRAYKTQR